MRNMFIIAGILGLVLLASCDSGSLTEAEATRLIREAKGYPKLLAITLFNIKRDSALGQEIERLIKDGYLIPGGYWSGHKVTDKGKTLVRKCVWNPGVHIYEVFLPLTHTQDIIGIKEILIDRGTNTARVTYEEGFAPTEYFNRLRSIDKQTIDKASEAAQKTFEKQIWFKKWDQGWRPG